MSHKTASAPLEVAELSIEDATTSGGADAADVAAAAAWGKTAGIVDGPNGSKLVLPVIPSVREAIMVAPDGTLSVFRGDLFQFLPK
ncbi:hypothetical protein [Mycobacterium sp. pR1184]|uniref:hypothetical protein n=1 Tax=Mycobacterium sp. pR1184 TaxID=3238981 RepID=UPI00351B0057